MLNYDLLPNEDSADGMRMYFEHGVMPGGFLTAVLENDLRGACERADDVNRHLLFEYVRWLYNYAPARTWGSVCAVEDHVARFQP